MMEKMLVPSVPPLYYTVSVLKRKDNDRLDAKGQIRGQVTSITTNTRPSMMITRLDITVRQPERRMTQLYVLLMA
jgi:hypothetical protein